MITRANYLNCVVAMCNKMIMIKEIMSLIHLVYQSNIGFYSILHLYRSAVLFFTSFNNRVIDFLNPKVNGIKTGFLSLRLKHCSFYSMLHDVVLEFSNFLNIWSNTNQTEHRNFHVSCPYLIPVCNSLGYMPLMSLHYCACCNWVFFLLSSNPLDCIYIIIVDHGRVPLWALGRHFVSLLAFIQQLITLIECTSIGTLFCFIDLQ